MLKVNNFFEGVMYFPWVDDSDVIREK